MYALVSAYLLIIKFQSQKIFFLSHKVTSKNKIILIRDLYNNKVQIKELLHRIEIDRKLNEEVA